MSFDRSRIQRQRYSILPQLGQGFEDGAPAATFGPAIEAVIDRRVRPVFLRTIAPSSTALQHVNDAADDPPVFLALGTRQPARQMRLEMFPLTIVQPKQVRAHSSPLRINSQSENHWTLIEYRP